MNLREALKKARVVPVLTVERSTDAVPLARALATGGLTVLEVTLRTAAALDTLRRIAAEVPTVVVGAGTVTKPSEVVAAKQAGARFAVSPGLTEPLAAAVREHDLPWLPGVMTPSEAMKAQDLGFEVLKFFPAGLTGGRDFLRSLYGPLSRLEFCPTGGIDQETFGGYLALPNVLCVGGSWVAPKDAVLSGDWSRITRLAQAAVKASENAP